MMNIKINKKKVLPHLRPLLKSSKPVYILFGSASSGKSYQMMANAVLWAMEGRNVLIARKEGARIKGSVWSECKKAMSRMGLEKYFDVRVSEFTMVNKLNNGAIIFTGVDDENKLKSITPPKATAIDTVILEEADAFTEEDYDQLRLRCRGECAFPKRAFMIFNPVSKQRMKWVWDRYFDGRWDDEVDNFYEDDEIIIQRCNYDQNEHLTDDDEEKFLRLKEQNPARYRVYGEGRFGATGKSVFDANMYSVAKLDHNELSKKGFNLYIGVDFGYVHSSTCVIVLHDDINNELFVTGLVSVKETTKPQFARLVRNKLVEYNIPLNTSVYCDSAEPSSIDSMVEGGVLGAMKAKKGNGSVTNQIDFLQCHRIFIDESCIELKREMDVLNYRKRKDGTYTEELDDRFGDDCVAGLRYAVSYKAYEMEKQSICGIRQVF